MLGMMIFQRWHFSSGMYITRVQRVKITNSREKIWLQNNRGRMHVIDLFQPKLAVFEEKNRNGEISWRMVASYSVLNLNIPFQKRLLSMPLYLQKWTFLTLKLQESLTFEHFDRNSFKFEALYLPVISQVLQLLQFELLASLTKRKY